MKEAFRKYARLSLILVYIVIIAGAVVRMTGSGMGCPDWPKCFGYLVPPTDRSQLEWTPDHRYRKGEVIIAEESLRVAKKDFQSRDTYSDDNWEAYTKHDYAIFNPWHTWIEYINRLATVLLGIPVLIMTFVSFRLYRVDKWLALGSLGTLFLLAIQSVLGKLVVDTQLKPSLITVHMVFAFIVLALLLFLLHRAREPKPMAKTDITFHNWVGVAVLLTLIQTILGTQVRQFVDGRMDEFGEGIKTMLLQDPTPIFYIHRSFSILILLLNLWLTYRNRTNLLGYRMMNWNISLIILEIIVGLAIYHLHFPFGSQPLHLVLATLIFGIQYQVFLESRIGTRTNKSL